MSSVTLLASSTVSFVKDGDGPFRSQKKKQMFGA